MNFEDAVKRACEEPNLLDALSWICVWENDRAVRQAAERYGTGAYGVEWATCFRV